MATPIGHSFAGWAAIKLFDPGVQDDHLKLLLVSVFMANAPDFDFLPGILLGTPALFHQGITHSLGLAIAASLVVATFFQVRHSWHFPKIFGVCLISYTSHLLLDFFGPDRRFPFGIPALWPITTRVFISQVPLLWGVHHAAVTSAPTWEWLNSMFDIYNIGAVALEIGWIAALVLIPIVVRKSLRPKRTN